MFQYYLFLDKSFWLNFRYLIQKVDYIDAERVGVWGHGYGGHLATRLLAEDKDREITCAIAVAPIAKWQNHGKEPFKLYHSPPHRTICFIKPAITNIT